MKASDNAIAPIIIRRPDKKIFQIRIVGDSSLIVHAWRDMASFVAERSSLVRLARQD